MRYVRALAWLRSVVIALGLSCGLLATPAHAQFDPYLTGSVGITARPSGPDVDSAGTVTVHKWNGEIDYSGSIEGFHSIYESDSGTQPTVTQEEIAVSGQYFGSVRTSADPGRCYRAQLVAVSPGADEITRGSAEQCFEDSCPVLVDMDADGFRLVGTTSGVDFDLDADGSPERLGWTSPGTLDGFLCRDRNRNGRIDDGRELFGTATPMAAGGTAGNGYLALQELDEVVLGGNGDGLLSSADALFRELCVWFDLDHDGFSESGELTTLEALGILDLDLDYRSLWRRDRYGNLFRFQSSGRIEHRDTDRRFQSYDVFFVSQPAGEALD